MTLYISEMGRFRFRNRNLNRNRPLSKLDGIGIESTTNFLVRIGIGIDPTRNWNRNGSIPALIHCDTDSQLESRFRNRNRTHMESELELMT